MRVEEMLNCDVVTIAPNTTVVEIARLLSEYRIGGLPGIDDEHRVIGIVTESDLFLKEKGVSCSAVNVPVLRDETLASTLTHADIFQLLAIEEA